MFDFFKKKETPVVAEKPVVTVEMIHAEFDDATANLILEANAILKKAADQMTPQAVAERLKKLGFTNTQFVQEQDLFVKSKEEAELVLYYNQHYPFQKYITEDQLNQICDKYGLIFAPVGSYKENVPMKNLEEIERAPELFYGDKAKDYVYTTYKWHHIRNSDGVSFPSRAQRAEIDALLGGKIEGKNFRNQFTAADYVKREYRGQLENGLPTYLFDEITNCKEDRQVLFIAAPPSHFDLTGKKKTSKFGFANVQEEEIKDPIVFRYVRGGVQVLTKWGEEGQDPMLYNEILN